MIMETHIFLIIKEWKQEVQLLKNRALQNFIKILRNKTRKSILKRWRSSMIIENLDFPRY